MALHKRFDFTQLGGFPISQETFAYIQEATSDLSQIIANIVGNNKIVSGLEIVNNGNSILRTAGFMTVNNELIPFLEGDGSIANFSVVENSENLLFENGESKSIKFNKYAVIDVDGEYVFSDLEKFSFSNISSAIKYDATVTNDNGIVSSGYCIEVVLLDSKHVRVDGSLIADESSLFSTGVDINIPNFPFNFMLDFKNTVGRISVENAVESQKYSITASGKTINVKRTGRTIISGSSSKCIVPIHGIFEIQKV